MEDQDRRVIFNDEYKPASTVLGETFENWYYYQHDIPTKKVWTVFVEGHTYNLPVVNRSILFRWMIPDCPNLYSPDDRFSPEAKKAGIYRLTYGKPYQKNDALGSVDEEYIKKVAKGLVEVDKGFMEDLNDAVKRTFTFNAWKIPHIDVRLDVVDDAEFAILTKFHGGPTAEKIDEYVRKKKEAQEAEKTKSLDVVKDKLRSLPDYLSILRELVQEKITTDEAIERAGSPGILIKGI